MFQDCNLLDTLTAYENIALALKIKGEKPYKIDSKIREVATYLEIEKVIDKYPYQMSGGQKQRGASARAIVTNPSLILADEPTGALDSTSARLLLERFESLNQDLKATLFMVPHDAFTARYATRIQFLTD
nr:ATP-binding cassette domain-containing protein [Clostridioides difficile]